MAAYYPSSAEADIAPGTSSTFLRKLQDHAPNSNQLVGFLTILISGSVLLVLTGLTVTATVLGLIVFAPPILISSPMWLPLGTFLFICASAFLSLCGFGVAVVATLSRVYCYFRGIKPPGSDGFDYARGLIYDAVSHVMGYASHYGGYLNREVEDSLPRPPGSDTLCSS